MTDRRPTILWLDNDRGLYQDYSRLLTENGYDVEAVESAIEAERALADREHDLVMIDVMVPTLNAEEELTYSPEETDAGYKTGLVFWKRNKEFLTSRGIPVLVCTVRLDEEIRDEFMAAGLHDENFATKYDLASPKYFLDKVRSLTKAR